MTEAEALAIATEAHAGQTDKAGLPYIEHPKAVAARLDDSDVDGRVVALLHDVVEDTPVTLDDLAAAGASDDVIEALNALTHLPDEPRLDYIERVWRIPLARRVKAADLSENGDPARLALLDPETAARLTAKYAQDWATFARLDAAETT